MIRIYQLTFKMVDVHIHAYVHTLVHAVITLFKPQ